MADTKISDLAAVTDLIGTDEYVLARAGVTKKIDASDLASEILALGTPGSSISWARVADHKSSGTEGGGFTSGAWRTRDLNTEVFDPDGIVTVSSNQFVLQAGTYLIWWEAPAFATNGHQSRLQDITAGATRGSGSSMVTGAGAFVTTMSTGSVLLTIAGATTYELQHQCQTTRATNGFGTAAAFTVATEVYASVLIAKLA